MIRQDDKKLKKIAHGCGEMKGISCIFSDLMELELLLLGSSSVPVSSTSLEMELVPFQFHQNWN